MIKNISNLGDAALYCDFGQDVNKETNYLVIKYFKTLKNKRIEGINNLIPSYNKLIVSYDLVSIGYFKLLGPGLEGLGPEAVKMKIGLPLQFIP